MSTSKECNKYTVIRHTYEGSVTGSVYFKTNKPYVSLECRKDALILTGIDDTVDDLLCFKSPGTNLRLTLPQFVMEHYGNAFDVRLPVEKSKNRTVIHVKAASKKEVKPPKGCHYSKSSASVDIKNYQKITSVSAPTLNEKIRGILKEYSSPYIRTTVVADDDKTYVLIEPVFNTFGCECESQEELRSYFGSWLGLFPKGTLSMLTDSNNFNIPQCFFKLNNLKNYAGTEMTAIYSNGASFVIVPEDKNCIFDNSAIKASEYKGKKVVLCEECSDKEAKEIITKLLHSIDELLNENEHLKESVGKEKAPEKSKSVREDADMIERLLENVDDILQENRLLKKLMM